MAGLYGLDDGRSYTIKVNGAVAEYLFDENGSETFDPVFATEWMEDGGDLISITPECRIEIKVWGVE